MAKTDPSSILPDTEYDFVEGGEVENSCEFFLNINGSSYITCQRIDGRHFMLQLVITGSNHVSEPVWVKGELRHAAAKAILMKEKYIRIINA